MNDRKVIFARHIFNPDIVKQLWERQAIALRFESISSVNPEDYKTSSAQSAIRRLRDYCRDGVLVGASYPSAAPSRMLIGRIGPGTPDELIRIEQLQDGYFHKVVQLDDVKEVSYRDYPLLAIQPRQNTISKWKISGNYLRCVYEGKELEWAVTSLTPEQLEVLCYEYLRTIGQIDALVMPIGRTLQAIDIYGIRADGGKVLAQVTHATNKRQIRVKRDQLQRYEGNGIELFFFGLQRHLDLFNESSIRYVPIEAVFSEMQTRTTSAQHMMIEHMLGKRR